MTQIMMFTPGCPCCTCKIDKLSEELQAAGITIRSAQHPQYPYPAWLSAEVKASAGESVSLYLLWDTSEDADPDYEGSGVYATWTPPSGGTKGTLKLYYRNGDEITTGVNLFDDKLDIWHGMTICYNPINGRVVACFSSKDADGVVLNTQCVSSSLFETDSSGSSSSSSSPSSSGYRPYSLVGRNAGYGGIGWLKNYQFDRLWYCGTAPYDDDCLQVQNAVYCHTCLMSCPTIFSDSFDRDDSSTLGGDWDVTGSAEIDDNQAVISGSGIAIEVDENPRAGEAIIASATFRNVQYDDLLRVIVDYKDATHYHYAEAKISSTNPWLRIYRVNGGAPVLLVSTNPLLYVPGNLTVSVCAVGSMIQALTTTGIEPYGVFADTTLHLGDRAGFGWDVAGNVIVDSFGFSPHRDSVPECTTCDYKVMCPGCVNGFAPLLVKVVIQGIVDGTGGGDCSVFNGTWILPYRGTVSRCNYYELAAGGQCGLSLDQIEFEVTASYLEAGWRLIRSVVGFRLGGAPFDCMNLVDQELPLYGSSPHPCCDWTNATCRVTAL